MSGTYHHQAQKKRHEGEDLWSKRPMSQSAYNAENKLFTRRIERSHKKDIIREELAQ